MVKKKEKFTMKRFLKTLIAISMVSMIAVCSASCGCQNSSDPGSSSTTSAVSTNSVNEGDCSFYVDDNGNAVLHSVNDNDKKTEVVVKEPEGKKVTEIGDVTFTSSKNLEKVVLPDNVEIIGNSAFRNCTKLSEINFPSSLKSIGTNAFSRTALKEVELPSGVETIGAGAFTLVTSLEKLTINEGLTKLENICDGDANLKELHLPATIKEIADDFQISPKTTIYTPENSVVTDYCKKNKIKYEIV